MSGSREHTGSAWCRARTREMDEWLGDLFARAGADVGEMALVAVGGYGRAELCPQSDIDVLLLHQGRGDIADVAERIWYPIWDEGVKLGHAVRTTREALSLAAADLDTVTSLLDSRHVAGASALTDDLRARVAALWSKRHRRWLPELGDRVDERQDRAGEVAFLLEPDLKEGRGGLRDVQAIRWAEAADRVMFEGDDQVLADAYEVVLAARVELHHRTGRPGDVLLLQEQDGVADALDDPDADALMARLAAAARTISWRSDEVWDRIRATYAGRLRWRSARDRVLDDGVLLRDGRIHLGSEADPNADPTLALRLAAQAASHGARIDRSSLGRLAAEAAAPPDPWPAPAREALVGLLGSGTAAIDVIESLDQVGMWVRLLPEWAPVRSRPQRNAYHRFTVDRHLCEAAAEASALVGRVTRPDLLLVGALFHDLGKGYAGEHTDAGVELVGTIGPRLGFDEDDTATLVGLVEHHLLLPDVATRRDLSDEGTIRHVAERVGDVATLRLLAALTEADSRATGPAAWGTWKAELVADLVARTEAFLDGTGPVEPEVEVPTEEQLEWLEARASRVVGLDDRLTVVHPDRTGLFSRVAGALALNGLDVLDAAAYTHGNGMALASFRVESAFGPTIAWERVVPDVEAALAGRLALRARLAERARVYRASTPQVRSEPARVVVDNDISPVATVLEVHATDAVGLLHRVTRAMAGLDLDIRSAKVQTLGADVVDSFYVVDSAGRKITDEGHLAEIERALLHAIGDADGES